MSETRPGFANALARPFVAFVERWYPDPILFVVVLTFLAFGLALTFTDASAIETVVAWGDGLPSLMAFTAQLSITLVTSHALANTRAVSRALARAAAVPRTSRQAYAVVAFVAGLASLLAWPLGLVVGATMASRVARSAALRGLLVDYPLLVASAYSGFVVWHMGYSGSAPLFVATPGHAMEAAFGVVPVAETILAGWNLTLAAVVLVAVSALCASMEPARDQVRPLSATAAARLAQDDVEPGTNGTAPETPGERVTHARAGSLALGALVTAYVVHWFATRGFSLSLDIVNWTFLAAGLLLARSPAHYVALVIDGGRTIGAILLQYPLYAGIMGVIAGTGLLEVLSDAVVSNATETTLPLWAFVSGGLLNLFVPSGGGQWAIQGPIFLEAARTLAVDPALVVMGVAYGDQWTNMIQPFWTIPLLAIAGLRVRDVLGYTFVTLMMTGVVFAGGLLLVAATSRGA